MKLIIGQKSFETSASLPNDQTFQQLLWLLPFPRFELLAPANLTNCVQETVVFCGGESVFIRGSDAQYPRAWAGTLDSYLVVIVRGKAENDSGGLEDAVVALYSNAAFQIDWNTHFQMFSANQTVTMQIIGGFGNDPDKSTMNVNAFWHDLRHYLSNTAASANTPSHLSITHALTRERQLYTFAHQEQGRSRITNIRIDPRTEALGYWNPEHLGKNLDADYNLKYDAMEFERRLRDYIGGTVIANPSAPPTSQAPQIFSYITGKGNIFMNEFSISNRQQQIKLLGLSKPIMDYAVMRIQGHTTETLIQFFVDKVAPQMFFCVSKPVIIAWARHRVAYLKTIYKYAAPSNEKTPSDCYGPYSPEYGGYQLPP